MKEQVDCYLIKKRKFRPINWSIYSDSYFCGNCNKELSIVIKDKYCRFCGSKFIDTKVEYDIPPKEVARKMVIAKYGEEKGEELFNWYREINNANKEN